MKFIDEFRDGNVPAGAFNLPLIQRAFEALPAISVKGKAEQIPIYRPLSPAHAQSREPDRQCLGSVGDDGVRSADPGADRVRRNAHQLRVRSDVAHAPHDVVQEQLIAAHRSVLRAEVVGPIDRNALGGPRGHTGHDRRSVHTVRYSR